MSGLTCDCGGDYDWYYSAQDYGAFNARRRKRCCSCKQLIDIGALSVRFERWRHPQDDIEERIHGEGAEIYLADYFMCEECGDLFYSLKDLGFCVDLPADMRLLVKEYADNYGPR